MKPYAAALSVMLAWSAMAAKPGTYDNPVLFADYSDPDAIRVGDDYYLTASTFHFSPGLPILKSKDLVHWTVVGHALASLDFDPRYGTDTGVWTTSMFIEEIYKQMVAANPPAKMPKPAPPRRGSK